MDHIKLDFIINGEIYLKKSVVGTDSFWQLLTTNDKLIILNRCDKTFESKRVYSSIEKINNDFIELSDFLEKATFVGREFKRTKPTKERWGDHDNSYLLYNSNFSFQNIVLYATQDLFLAIRIDNSSGKEEYTLINSIYTLDGNYGFFGPVYEKYRDKNKVYQEILAQISG